MAVADLSASAQISRILAGGAQAIIVGASGTPFGTFLRAVRDSGTEIPIVSGAANLSFRQMEGVATHLPRGEVFIMGFPAFAPDLATFAGVQRAVKTMRDTMAASDMPKPEIGAVVAWDAAFIAVDALRKKGVSATGARLREYISNLRGFSGA